MEKQQVRTNLIRFIKYGIVGVSNTLVTFVVIFICNSIFGLDILIANPIGYIAGVINSFIWNKQWVFHSKNKLIAEMGLFASGFLACFCLQYVVLLTIKQPCITTAQTMLPADFSFYTFDATAIGEYAAVAIAMVVYTVSNFIFNSYVTFRKKKQP